jgi:hypothetical protein
MDIEKIREKIKNGQYEVRFHARKRMGERKITMEQVKDVILTGKIIESYPDDTPYPSCLILGYLPDEQPLYVVCALGKMMYIITAHWLDPEKWLDPKTRREKKI